MRVFLLLLGLSLLYKFSYAQVAQGGRPLQTVMLKSSGIPVIEMPAVNNLELRKNFRQRDTGQKLKPLTFAYPFTVQISPSNSGVWLPTVNGYQIWKVKIRSTNAKSINLIFDDFKLPPGARLFVFNATKDHYLGAFTQYNNKSSGKFAVSPVAGDEITVQYEVPDTQKNTDNFIIAQVNHAFEDILKYDERRPLNKTAGSCNVDVNCDIGDPWNEVKDAVCRIIVNGIEICTGTLLNNVEEDEKPYVISASHCYDKWEYAETSVYTFNYESPFCAPLDGDPGHSVSGAVMKAQFDSLDFALTELSLVPPPEYHPYFAGWDRQALLTDSSTTIHHPQGDIKKISFDDDLPEFSDFNLDYVNNAFLKIFRWEAGVTENGSSGGPLFNIRRHLIGTLTGGVASCSNPVQDYFSRFDMAWNYKNDTTKQLKHWLDPNDSGVLNIDGKRFVSDENFCDAYTHLTDADNHELVPLTTSGNFSGYWGGTNNTGITEFMERFVDFGYREIAAVSLGIGKLDIRQASQNSRITIKIYNGGDYPESLIHEENVQLKNLAEAAMNRVELSSIVQPADTFFVGFALNNVNAQDSIVLYQSLREPERINHFYFMQNGQWMNFKTSNTSNFALTNVIELLACNITEKPIDTSLVDNPREIIIYPNPTHSSFTLETGKNISLEDIQVFNLLGQEVEVHYSNLQEKKVEVNLTGNLAGVYFVRFNTGEGFVTHKLSFVPW